jgi:hypothetical protein
MHARHYSPALGRFIQPDPSGAEANLYVYAADSPVTRADACGTFSLREFFRCRNLRNDIINLRNELMRRQAQLREDALKLRFGGAFGRTLFGEQIQFQNKQRALRRLLTDFDTNSCGGPPPFGYGQKLPRDTRYLASRQTPKFHPRFSTSPSHSGAPSTNWGPAVVVGAGGLTIAGIVWWALKPAAVVCGPFVWACAFAF